MALHCQRPRCTRLSARVKTADGRVVNPSAGNCGDAEPAQFASVRVAVVHTQLELLNPFPATAIGRALRPFCVSAVS